MFPYVLCSYARLTLLYPDILIPTPLLTQTLFAQSLYNAFRPPDCPTPLPVCNCSSAVTVSCARIMYVACSHSLNKQNVSLSLTLRQLALLTSRRNERILPFHLAPWAVPLVKEFPGRVHL